MCWWKMMDLVCRAGRSGEATIRLPTCTILTTAGGQIRFPVSDPLAILSTTLDHIHRIPSSVHIKPPRIDFLQRTTDVSVLIATPWALYTAVRRIHGCSRCS